MRTHGLRAFRRRQLVEAVIRQNDYRAAWGWNEIISAYGPDTTWVMSEDHYSNFSCRITFGGGR